MNEFIEKLIGRLENLKSTELLREDNIDENGMYNDCEEAYEDGESNGRYQAYVKIIKLVNQLAEEYKDTNVSTIDAGELLGNGWIPCSERLPEEYTEVLGYGIDGHIYMVELCDTKIYGKVWKQWNGGDIRLRFIDAWQPLPAPYQPKGE